jgi:hypothetical protein
MANRTFMDKQYTMVKRRVELYAAVLGAGAAAPSLRKWNYPTLGTGPNARTYTAAPTANALPTGAAYPLQYACGAEGVRSVTRTGVGLWTVQLQDNYQRVLMVSHTTDLAGGAATIRQVWLNTTITNLAAVGGSIIGLFLGAGGAATDLPAGHLLLLKFDLADATEP